MTTKEKYELIDKTKINEKVLAILQNMEKSSSNFTDEAVNSKIDGALDKLIEGFRANKPEALRTLPEAKKEVKKEKEKATKENEGKDLSDKKDTDDKTGLPKKDTLEERKDIIKKQSESEKEARDRARKELEKEKDKAKDEVESQIEKLNRLILEDPSLRGFNTGTAATGGGRSTPIIDAERKALPRGSRVSQKGWKNQYGASDGGRKYWENRENRSDRKSPEYETGKPYLAKGGNVYSSDEMYQIAMVKGDVDLDTISIRAKNKGEARMIFEDTYRDKYENELGDFEIEIYLVKPLPESDSYAQGGVIKAVVVSNAKGGYMADGGETDGELYIAYENTFKRFDSDVPVPMEDFEKLLHAYQKQLSGDKLDVVKYEVLKGQMGNYLGHKTVDEMEAYFIQRRNSYKMANGGLVEEIKMFDKYNYPKPKTKGDKVRAIFEHFKKKGYSTEEINTALGKMNYAKGGYMAKGGSVLESGYYAYPSGDEGDELGVFKDKESMISFALANKDKYRKLIFEGIENDDILEVKKGDSKDVITWVFSRIGMDTKEANKKIKMWFISNYPDEEEAKQIDESVTFDDIWFDLKDQRNIYDRLGNHYVVREVFEKIASIYGVEYDFVEKMYKRESYAKGGFMADGGVINTRQLNKKIKDWYIKTYPTDEEGKEIDDKITFKAFYGYLWQGYDVYDVLEVNDSLIRERVFEKLSEILGVDYDVVYKKWLQSGEYSKGGMMADGGGVPYKPYGKTKGRFKLTYEVEGESQSEIRESLEEAMNSAKRYSSPKLGYTDVHIYDESGKEYFFADGGQVDFQEKMAKMRSAYENLNMIVKSRIALAIGIDRAISIMERDYSIDPFDLIISAVRSGLLELDEINKDLVNEAVYEAERVTDDYRDSGQGIGGSDMTYFTKNVLDSVGYKTGFVSNRLTRVDADGNELVIDKYEMNY